MKTIYLCLATLLGCSDPPPPPAPPAPPPQAPPLGPVAPGAYTNHVGNPAAGSWGPDGQWQWHNPQSAEADSTMKYLAAAGLGAAAGGLAAHMLTKRQFERENPKGWDARSSTREVTTYLDKRGNPISREEYERRRAQSERDKARYREQQQQRQKTAQQKAAPAKPAPAQPEPTKKWAKPWKAKTQSAPARSRPKTTFHRSTRSRRR